MKPLALLLLLTACGGEAYGLPDPDPSRDAEPDACHWECPDDAAACIAAVLVCDGPE